MRNAISLIIALASTVGSYALAEVNVDVEVGRRPRVVEVQPAPVIERVWIPDRIVRKTETVMVSPPHRERRVDTVCVAPAHTERQEMRVLVAPARIECVKEKLLIHPAHVERQLVPASASGEARIGPVTIRGSTDDGYWREIVIPAEYQVVERKVEIPAKYEIVARDVEIPARYERVVKEVEVPAKYDEVTREIVVPGHYEDRTVVVPPTVVVEPKRPLIDLDLEFGKKKHDRD